ERRELLEDLLAEDRVLLHELALAALQLAGLVHQRRWQLRIADVTQQRTQADGLRRLLVEAQDLRDRDGTRRDALGVAHRRAVVALEGGRDRDERIGRG